MAAASEAPKMKPTLGLTGVTVNAMALIAPGAFLWITFVIQAGYVFPSGLSMWAGIFFAIMLAYATAGGHHERVDGTGYPRGLKREQMSLPARMIAIADVFEALTAEDRPYKRAKTVAESLAILGQMKLSGHVDPDLFDVFVRERVWVDYARKFLDPAQIDAVDLQRIPGSPAP